MIIVKAKRLCIMVGKYHGDKIDKPIKMIWPKFATEVLQIMTGIGEMALSKKHLSNRVHLEHEYIIKL